MRILLFTDAWTPQVNGVVRAYQNTIKSLEKKGHEVLVVHPEMFTTIPCPSYPEIRLAIYGFSKVRKQIKNFKPQAIHIATEGPVGKFGRRYCLRNNIPFTSSFHTKFAEYLTRRIPIIPLAFGYWYLRRFHNKAVRTMYNTEGMKQTLREWNFKGELVHWSRGVDKEIFKPNLKIKERYEKPIYLYVGRVATEKNIEAFLDLEAKGTKVVVGEGPYLSYLKKKYPKVKFVGYKFGRELAKYYSSSNVFVFPSKTDTLGIVSMEAVSCGTPVAAFNVTGPKDILTNGVNSYLGPNLVENCKKCLKLDRKKVYESSKNWDWERCSEQFYKNLEPLHL